MTTSRQGPEAIPNVAGHATNGTRIGASFIRLSALALVLSSTIKFAHPDPIVAYMGSMGYVGGTYYLIAGVEMVVGTLLLIRGTRPVGVLLGSAYFGGAVASHLAIHTYSTGGPFLEFMAGHPYVGALEPGIFLAFLWFGTWLAGLLPGCQTAE